MTALVAVAVAVALVCALAGPAQAAPGHAHGDEAPAAAGTASPRVSAHSDLFELVGIVEHETMTLYLDRYASNEPVRGARLDIEAGDATGTAVEQADGSYVFRHGAFEKGGSLPLTFTVSAGKDTDLLAGDLVIGAHGDDSGTAAVPGRNSALLTAAVAGGLVLVLASALVFRRLRARRRDARAALPGSAP